MIFSLGIRRLRLLSGKERYLPYQGYRTLSGKVARGGKVFWLNEFRAPG
jgi:hypothetical protein